MKSRIGFTEIPCTGACREQMSDRVRPLVRCRHLKSALTGSFIPSDTLPLAPMTWICGYHSGPLTTCSSGFPLEPAISTSPSYTMPLTIPFFLKASESLARWHLPTISAHLVFAPELLDEFVGLASCWASPRGCLPGRNPAAQQGPPPQTGSPFTLL